MNCNLSPLVFLLLLSMLWTSFSACLFCLPPCLASIFFFYHQMIALLYLIFYYQSPHEWGASFSSSFLRFLSLCLLFTIDCSFLYSFLCSFTLSVCVCVYRLDFTSLFCCCCCCCRWTHRGRISWMKVKWECSGSEREEQIRIHSDWQANCSALISERLHFPVTLPEVALQSGNWTRSMACFPIGPGSSFVWSLCCCCCCSLCQPL